ncbi:MAG: hypothetical protein GX295_06245 [Syntrophomonadaceae bacterium]|nr:hypothetical protein [Syntrophomonadaceae bacterium]
MKVEFFPRDIEGVWGLDLVVRNQQATVQDLIEAIQPWCDDEQIFKAYLEQKRGACKGCAVNCCRECFVLPDIISFRWLQAYLGLSPAEFLQQYFDPELLAQGLPRLRSSPCIFLQEGLCTVYPYRTLICRLYICTPMTDAAQNIVYAVVAAGIGEFYRLAKQEGYLPQKHGATLQGGYERMLQELVQFESERTDNPFREALNYGEIQLRSFCSDTLWRAVLDTNAL